MAKKIKVYKPKALINGKVLGKAGDFVAIPDKGYKDCEIHVVYKGVTMIVKDWMQAQEYRRFKDKWGRGTYTLAYFKFTDVELPDEAPITNKENMVESQRLL